MGRYGFYILGSYGFTALVIGVLVWRSYVDYKTQSRLADKLTSDKSPKSPKAPRGN